MLKVVLKMSVRWSRSVGMMTFYDSNVLSDKWESWFNFMTKIKINCYAGKINFFYLCCLLPYTFFTFFHPINSKILHLQISVCQKSKNFIKKFQ
jgi:hypothetical protein